MCHGSWLRGTHIVRRTILGTSGKSFRHDSPYFFLFQTAQFIDNRTNFSSRFDLSDADSSVD